MKDTAILHENASFTAKRQLRDAIASHAFTSGFSAALIDALARFAMAKNFVRDETIFEQGDIANRFYLINSGYVCISSESRAGREVEIETIGAGDVLGWSWLFEPQKWQFDARALGNTETLFFYGTPLLAHLEENPDLGFELMSAMTGVVVRRLQKTREKLLQPSTD